MKLKKRKPVKSYKENLEDLKKIDPEFYDFLKQNDKKLLEFDIFESDNDDSDNETEPISLGKDKDKNHLENFSDDGDIDEDKFHKPKREDLEVASDESDFEGDKTEDSLTAENSSGVLKVTLNLLRQWQLQLEQPNVPIDIIRKVIQAFSSALASISGDPQAANLTAFKVEGAAIFNGVVQLCVLHLQPAVMRVLGISPGSKTPIHKTKKWTKVRACLRYYFTDLMRLIENISNPNILSVLLKHLHQMAIMVASFSNIGKNILKRLIVLWSTSDEAVRVLAFLCILKITRNQQVSMLNHVLKAMYLSYVRNSKFVSPNTLPSINFMRRSLVEMFALDLTVSYQHAFLYIRQLAIHLRNAVILKKKNSFQSVYNWQFINSIRLWADLLGTTTPNKPHLEPLIYPLVTIVIGVIKLIPTAQYFPLRFHCIQSLITLAKETHTFIPVMPFIVEVLKSNTFQSKHTVVSMKPMQFTCVLRLNKGQLSENGFRDEVVEQVCSLLLEYLAHESSSIAYTDLVVPIVSALNQYLKHCKNANYSRKIKQLLDKIRENANFIENERRKVTFGLQDLSKVQAWETEIRNKGTPLSIYYNSWVKTHETKKRRQAANSGDINDYDIPIIKRKPIPARENSIRNQNGQVELFPSDSEMDEFVVDEEQNDKELASNEQGHQISSKPKKPKKQKMKHDKSSDNGPDYNVPLEEEIDEGIDIVKDLDLNDW